MSIQLSLKSLHQEWRNQKQSWLTKPYQQRLIANEYHITLRSLIDDGDNIMLQRVVLKPKGREHDSES